MPGLQDTPGAVRIPANSRRPLDSAFDRIESLVLDSVKKDPFLTISELAVVIEESLPGNRPGWWGIFTILRKHRLVLRRSRFRFARRHWKSY